MATAPVIRDWQQSSWNAAAGLTKALPGLSIQSGDLIVVRASTETSAHTLAITNDGAALTWTQRQTYGTSGNFCRGYIWTATGDTTRSLVITLTNNTSAKSFGGVATSFSSHGGLGLSTSGTGTTSAPDLPLAVAPNSWIGVINSDWSAADGASRVWRTVAGALTERNYYRDVAAYATYAGDHLNGSAPGVSLGLTVPASQSWSLGVIEVLGTATGDGGITGRGDHPLLSTWLSYPIASPDARPWLYKATLNGSVAEGTAFRLAWTNWFFGAASVAAELPSLVMAPSAPR